MQVEEREIVIMERYHKKSYVCYQIVTLTYLLFTLCAQLMRDLLVTTEFLVQVSSVFFFSYAFHEP